MWQIFRQFNFQYMHRGKMVAISNISGSSEDPLVKCGKTLRGEQSVVISWRQWISASELLGRINSQDNYHCLRPRGDNLQCRPSFFSKHELQINLKEQSVLKEEQRSRCVCFGKEQTKSYNNEIAEDLRCFNFLGPCLHLITDSPAISPSAPKSAETKQPVH